MNLNTVFFIGPQGSGKGTQAKMLAGKLGFFHWDMGAILRETAEFNTDLGKTVKDLVDRGVLIHDELLLEVAKTKLETISPQTGVVFDGIPRRIGQAEFLLNFLKQQGRNNFATIYLNIPRENSLERLLLRGQTQGRVDDTKEKIEFRLKQYEEDTLPVLDFLKKESAFHEIDGTPGIETVTQKINETLQIA